MRKALAVLLVLAVTAPLYAQKKIQTVTPDEALKQRGKWVNVCGVVQAVMGSDRESKLYFENTKGEAIWARPILELSERVDELLGAKVCAYGRAYWNLEGLGIDTERVEFIGAMATPTAAPAPTSSASVPVLKPKKKDIPWEAILAGAAIGVAAYSAYQLAKDDKPPATSTTPPRHGTTPAPQAEKKPPRGIDLGAYGGGVTSQELIVLSGDSSRTFLGCLTCSEFDASSIRNDYGIHSKYGGESIRNSYSQYGSPYATTSACNRYATEPPIIVDRSGNFYGELTVNEYRPNRTRMQSALTWLAAVCQGR